MPRANPSSAGTGTVDAVVRTMINPSTTERVWDVVDEAGLESFPASDPPGWGSFHASTNMVEPAPAGIGRHLVQEERGPRYLVVFTSASPRTRWIAEAVAHRLRALGSVAEIADVTCPGMPHPADYEAAVVGISVGLRVDHSIFRWLHHARPHLDETPTALYIVGHPHGIDRALHHVGRIGWRPSLIAKFPHPGLRDRLSRVVHRSVDRDDATALATRFEAVVSRRGSVSK